MLAVEKIRIFPFRHFRAGGNPDGQRKHCPFPGATGRLRGNDIVAR